MGCQWRLDPALGLLLPLQPAEASVICFVSTDDALAWRPWPEDPSTAAAALPMTAADAAASDARQRRAHALAVGAHEAVRGYASWVVAGACAAPLLVREEMGHTGTHVWHAAWAHREWAVGGAPSDLFEGRAVLELGAGAGLLGLSIAARYARAEVTVSDFEGHSKSARGTVLDCLVGNCARNVPLIGGRVRVCELDWARPDEPRALWPDAGVHAVVAADTVVATEVVYTTEGARLLAGAVAACMRRPAGQLYLLNNARRTGVGTFVRACEDQGMLVERLPVPRASSVPLGHSQEASIPMGGIVSTFSPWCSDQDSDEYVFFRVTWSAN
ncbi:hypothetical protein AB1Y20_001656 [Prymnesium parvum]|uniref:Calmodulin-lysine N-methyltransferase n=1 Tax=Prymnesium parvum TaxID=97485 RepID=A0AB34KBR8_PRYPA